MKVKQRTYVLLALAGLLALVGAVIDLWFYTIGAIALALYVTWRLLTFVSIVRQLDLDIQREATRAVSATDLSISVCVSVCSNINVVGFFADSIPDDFILAAPVDPARVSLTRGERVRVRYSLTATRDVDLKISRSSLRIETDLLASTIYFTTAALEMKTSTQSRAIDGPAGTDQQLGYGLTNAPGYGLGARQQIGPGFELSHVQPYAPGDPRNRIDWKTSAKLNELMTKVFFAEDEDSGIGFGAPITVIVDQGGGLVDAVEGQVARDFAAEIVEHIAHFASANRSLMDVVTFNTETLSRVALHEEASRVSQWARSLERPPAGPSVLKPARRKSGITSMEVQRFEKGLASRGGGDGARFREVISYLYKRKDAYLRELHRTPAYRAATESIVTPQERSALILISDLESDVDPIIEGMRFASHAGSHVYLVSFFSKLFQRSGDAFITSEALYRDYDRFKVQLSKVACVPAVKVIEAPSADYLTFLESGHND